ncbi:MAG: ABC transporter permease [Caldilineaceae bacterium]|nr:ABC transporter permease [Caldilineaceae bacterium]MCY3992254.1 ABC transporter permease [Caldilineaceae bacterium]MDE0077879.1 ABC transporter permease [Caldilineaceae bacterium]MDE0310851.1 ABC transporter permease [Caldilineaceae bacterium]
MARYTVVRLAEGLVVLLLISVATFLIMRLLPGDPVMILLGEGGGGIRMTEEQIEAIHRKWGLDDPWHVQYLLWVKNMFTGNFGQSIFRPGVPVREMIFEAIPVTFNISAAGLIIALALAIPMGIMAATKRNSLFDYAATIFSTLGVALPNFWVALMLIVLFSLVLKWLPPFGLHSWQGYIMPVMVIATMQMAVIMRVTRGSLIEELGEDYVRTARAKGLAERGVIGTHAIRNALLPVVTVIGVQFAYILSGTIIVETVFALPGIGRLFTDSVLHLDYQVVQSIVFLLAVIVVVVNLLTDLTYALIDPRIRIE